MEQGLKALALLALALGTPSLALAVPAVFDIRYEFTTDDLFLAKFGVQATIEGVARYSIDQPDQLPADPVSGLYNLISHRIRIDGTNTTAAPNPFGVYTSEFNVLNDLGLRRPAAVLRRLRVRFLVQPALRRRADAHWRSDLRSGTFDDPFERRALPCRSIRLARPSGSAHVPARGRHAAERSDHDLRLPRRLHARHPGPRTRHARVARARPCESRRDETRYDALKGSL